MTPSPSRGHTACLYDLDRSALGELLAAEPAYRVNQLWQGLYADLTLPHQVTTLPAQLRSQLATIKELRPGLTMVKETGDSQTVKWLYQLNDGGTIETVLMNYAERATVCVSSQAGCAMACSFCATGQGGFSRHLSTGEIVEQVIRATQYARRAQTRPPSNIVFMGMGEPLANYDSVMKAIARIHNDLGFGARHITVSTVGIAPGIIRLAREELPVNLAISLHAANDTLRNQLVPINKRYPLNSIKHACIQYLQEKNRRITFEWALINETNDTERDARELAAFARPLGAHVNVIPLNPTPGYLTVGSSAARVKHFCSELQDLGINVTVRDTRGSDFDAACGQLAARNKPS